jgi:tetratricopeptide (TPR) repeat protein
MVDVQPMGPGLLHVVFLERAAREHDSAQSRFGQAAFLVLRLIDLLGANETAPNGDELFGYQAAATGRYCHEQLEPGPQTDRLLDLVSAASYAHRRSNPGLIAPVMFDLTRDLIVASHFEEALDVLTTFERTAGAQIEPSAAITVAMLTGRAKRLTAQFDEAEVAYRRAGVLATAHGDHRMEAFSRLGCTIVHQSRGNLADAEREYFELLGDARALGDRGLESQVENGIGMVLGYRGQTPDAVRHFWTAFELSQDDPEEAIVALYNLGYSLGRLGVVEAAERAFRLTLERAHRVELTNNALIELMHCASYRRDRVGFARWSGECGRVLETMQPNQLTDYHLKLGIGLARFGRFDRATHELRLALEVARAHGLHEFEFRIERIAAELSGCEASQTEREEVTPAWAATLDEVSRALAGLLP